MSEDSQGRTWLCSVAFLDIAGYTGRPVVQQIEIKQHLQDITSAAIRTVPESDRIMIDTGDGAALCFFGDPEEALFTALNIRATILGDVDTLPVPYQVRIGINLGPVKVVQSISGQRNPLGDGINNAQRVMGFANPNQILVSRSFYDVVACLSVEHTQIFRHIGERHDKHDKTHDVYEVLMRGETPATTSPSKDSTGVIAGWDDALLARIAASLAAHVGPMAKVLVKRAAESAGNLAELKAAVAAAIPGDAGRDAFLNQFGWTPDAPGVNSHELSSTPSTPLADSEWLTQLTRCLAEYLGPVARILVNKAARSARNEKALIEQLTAELVSEDQRLAFQQAASRIKRTSSTHTVG